MSFDMFPYEYGSARNECIVHISHDQKPVRYLLPISANTYSRTVSVGAQPTLIPDILGIH